MGASEKRDALPVNAVDPIAGGIFPAELRLTANGYILERSQNPHISSELFISPGWIDFHAHVYDGTGKLSIPVDAVGINSGVHLVVDAGSAGEETIAGFRKYVVPRFATAVKALLNISSIGLAYMPEASDIALLDVEKTIKAAEDNRPFIFGIKVRSEKSTVGALGIQPVKLAAAAARATKMPLMVHIGAPPPNIEDILDLLIAGDVVTHCYHGKTCPPWQTDGKPIPSLKKALDRGVLLDVGHGATSFSYEIAKKAISAGYPPFTIGTDVHTYNLTGPVYDLPTTMTKLLACGLSLTDVIAGVTKAPAEVLQLENWCDFSGVLTNATLFQVSSAPPSDRRYLDSVGKEIIPEAYIVPKAVITGQEIRWI